jgi:nitroimidazol reductase NimA-like FMN-containing flavoprotein (pyridoxamine 5'-phosphate oxidase superfamily)
MMQLSHRVEQVLAAHETLVLATVGAEGQPEAASVFFVPEQDGAGLLLICALLSSSAKLRDLRQNPRAGVFIGPQAPTRWLQAACTATIVEEPEERGRRLRQLVEAVPASRTFVERVPVTPVVFRVRRIKLTDLTGGQPPVETMNDE